MAPWGAPDLDATGGVEVGDTFLIVFLIFPDM